MPNKRRDTRQTKQSETAAMQEKFFGLLPDDRFSRLHWWGL